MSREFILIVDDEQEIGELLGRYLHKEGYTYEIALTGLDGLEKARTKQPDLILLDVFLPDIDGHEVCRQLRTFTDTPILFLSCKDTELDKVVGLSIGADDYISKPFGINELMARIKAHLRRSKKRSPIAAAAAGRSSDMLASATLTVDLKRHEAYLHGHKLILSAKEFHLLVFLLSHPKQVLSPEHILEQVWGYDYAIDTKTVKVHIGNLRKKIEDDPREPKKIVTIRGVGYRFDEEMETA